MNRRKLMGLIMIIVLFIAVPASAEGGKFSVGAFGGWSWNTADDAIWGRSGTEFESTGLYGGSIMYRFPQQVSLEIVVEHLEMDLKESGDDLGTLNMTPVMLLLGAQGMPKYGTGFTGHVHIGAGINFTSFDVDSSVLEIDSVDTENSFVYEIGAGADYFISEDFSFSLGGRWMGGEVESEWNAVGPSRIPVGDFTFYIYNLQVLLGARYWF